MAAGADQVLRVTLWPVHLHRGSDRAPPTCRPHVATVPPMCRSLVVHLPMQSHVARFDLCVGQVWADLDRIRPNLANFGKTSRFRQLQPRVGPIWRAKLATHLQSAPSKRKRQHTPALFSETSAISKKKGSKRTPWAYTGCIVRACGHHRGATQMQKRHRLRGQPCSRTTTDTASARS